MTLDWEERELRFSLFLFVALNNHMENFQGQDGFVWFTGVVEDRNDPTKLGRVRVRCVGYHTDNKTKIPTEDLPWAWVLQTIHTPSMNGMGHTPGFLVEGTWVVGFFRDAETLQEPIIMGSLPGVPETEIVWRFHFMLGATTFAISGNGLPALFSNTDIKMENTSTSQKLLMNRLMTFLVGGLRAPLSKNMTTYESSCVEKN